QRAERRAVDEPELAPCRGESLPARLVMLQRFAKARRDRGARRLLVHLARADLVLQPVGVRAPLGVLLVVGLGGEGKGEKEEEERRAHCAIMRRTVPQSRGM